MGLLWKIGGIALACVAAYLLVTMYGKSRYHAGELTERTKWQSELVKAEKAKAAEFERGLAQREGAETVYHETVRQLPPITTRIVERTTQYAATPAGAAQCLSVDRVLGVYETRSALFPGSYPPAPGGVPGTLLTAPVEP